MLIVMAKTVDLMVVVELVEVVCRHTTVLQVFAHLHVEMDIVTTEKLTLVVLAIVYFVETGIVITEKPTLTALVIVRPMFQFVVMDLVRQKLKIVGVVLMTVGVVNVGIGMGVQVVKHV